MEDDTTTQKARPRHTWDAVNHTQSDGKLSTNVP